VVRDYHPEICGFQPNPSESVKSDIYTLNSEGELQTTSAFILPPMSQPTPFHRLFGLSWIDFFDGTDVEVETELDLSIKKQFIDVIIVRKGKSPIPRRLPDGFEVLAPYNLVTFKSYQEALDDYTLLELIGHLVNYRKRISPSLDSLLPMSDFRMFAVSVRFPSNLSKKVILAPMQTGVYDVEGFGTTIRVIVVNELPQENQNAMLHLFSAQEKLIRYGQEHYHPHSSGISTLLLQLLNAYTEDQTMHPKLEEFERQSLDEILKKLPPDKLRKFLPIEERLKGLSVEETIQALSPEVIEALTRRLKSNGSAPKAE